MAIKWPSPRMGNLKSQPASQSQLADWKGLHCNGMGVCKWRPSGGVLTYLRVLSRAHRSRIVGAHSLHRRDKLKAESSLGDARG